jgi:molybdopterin converting factor small subunit
MFFMAELILKDGSKKEFADGISLAEAVKQLSNSLAKKVLVAKVNGEVTDLREPITDGSTVEFLTFDDQAGKDTLRHTASHVMAQAIQHLFPGVKFAIGPSIENGFYYDLDTEHRFTQEDFPAIEAEMAKIVKENLPLTKEVVSREDALKLFKEAGQDYKVELIRTCRKMPKFPSTARAISSISVPAPIRLLPALSKPSNCRPLPVPTGAVMNTTRCSSVFTGRLLKRNPTSMITSTCWKKPKSAIIVNWANSSTCSASTKKARASRSSIAKGMVLRNTLAQTLA